MVDLLDCLHLRLNGRVFRLRLLVSLKRRSLESSSRLAIFFNSLHLSLSLMEDREEEDTEASKSSSCFRSERSFVGGSRASIDR